MAEKLYFSRHTKVYLEQGANIWEIPVMDGFSFSQGTNSSEVVLAEMESAGGVSRRGRTMFNDSYAPAEWSFDTYVRPFIGAVGGALDGDVAQHHAVEEALWANFVSPFDLNNTYVPGVTTTDGAWGDGATEGVVLTGTEATFDFSASNTSTLGVFNLLFELGSCEASPTPIVYRVEGCVVNSASVDFDIDGIATISWSGFGNIIDEIITGDTAHSGTYTVPIVPTIAEDLLATDNFIRNRLTSLSIVADDEVAFPGSDALGTYKVVLTGGSLSFENNITFLTPETLCTVNQPIGHVTGGRTVGGSFTSYIDTDSGATHDLWEDLIEATDTVTNKFALSFAVGGAAGTPRVDFSFPQAHLEIPTHSIDDLVAVEVNFSALPSSISGTDESTIAYTGAA